MKTTIYTVTHKKVFELPEHYCWIQGGTAINGEIPGILHDSDAPDNRSLKNPYYSELSAYYFILKNDQDSDIIGTSHYRRFFDDGKWAIQPMSAKHAEQILKKADIILPYHEGIGKIEEQFIHYHKEEDWRTYLEVLKEFDPDFYCFYSNYVKYKKELSMRNMFIAHREVVFAFLRWMFSVLDVLEDRIDLNNRDNYDKRLFGFLAERTVEPWFKYHKYKIKYQFIYNTEGQHNRKIRSRKRIHQIIRNIEM